MRLIAHIRAGRRVGLLFTSIDWAAAEADARVMAERARRRYAAKNPGVLSLTRVITNADTGPYVRAELELADVQQEAREI